MKFEILRSYVGRSRYGSLVLNDPNCKVELNRTHAIASTALSGCGTTRNFTLTSVIYSNVLRSRRTNSVISRGKIISIPFQCEYVLRNRNRNRVELKPQNTDENFNNVIDSGRRLRSLRNGRLVEVNTRRNYTVVLKTRKFLHMGVMMIPNNCYVKPVLRRYRKVRHAIIHEG